MTDLLLYLLPIIYLSRFNLPQLILFCNPRTVLQNIRSNPNYFRWHYWQMFRKSCNYSTKSVFTMKKFLLLHSHYLASVQILSIKIVQNINIYFSRLCLLKKKICFFLLYLYIKMWRACCIFYFLSPLSNTVGIFSIISIVTAWV